MVNVTAIRRENMLPAEQTAPDGEGDVEERNRKRDDRRRKAAKGVGLADPDYAETAQNKPDRKAA